MVKFKTASRTPAEMSEHKEKLNEIFARVANKGRIDRRALKQLNDNRVEVAETIVQLIADEHAVVDPLPLLVQHKTQNFVDRNLFQRLDGTLTVVNRSYGTKPLSQRMTSEEFTFNTSMKEIAVELPLEEIAGGHITAAQVVEAMAWAIARYKVNLVLSAIDAAVAFGPDHTGVGINGTSSTYNLRYTGFTRANFDNALDGLMDDGMAPTIFGRHIALHPAMRSFTNGFSQEKTAEIEKRGQVGSYNGAPVVTLIDKWSRILGAHQVSPDRAWIAGSNSGAWYVEKDVSFLNYAVIDERTSTFATGIRLEDGVAIVDKYQYRIVTR